MKIAENFDITGMGDEARFKSTITHSNIPTLDEAALRRLCASNGWTLGREVRVVAMIPALEYEKEQLTVGRPLDEDDGELRQFIKENPEVQTCKMDTGHTGRIIIR